MAHQPLGYTHTSHATYEEPPLAQIGYRSLISRRGKTRIWISAWGLPQALHITDRPQVLSVPCRDYAF